VTISRLSRDSFKLSRDGLFIAHNADGVYSPAMADV